MPTKTAAQRRAEAKQEYDAFLAGCPSRQLLDVLADKWVTLPLGRSLQLLVSGITTWAETHVDDVLVAREADDRASCEALAAATSPASIRHDATSVDARDPHAQSNFLHMRTGETHSNRCTMMPWTTGSWTRRRRRWTASARCTSARRPSRR